jgi:hypothetical protein
MSQPKTSTTRERIEAIRTLNQNPIVWVCPKKHEHLTRTCPYNVMHPTGLDIAFLLGELDRRAALLEAEEVYDY